MKRTLLLPLLFLFSYVSYAQNNIDEHIKSIEDKLDSIDTKSISTKYFLNKGFLSGDLIADYHEFKEHKEDNFILNDKKTFRRIYRGLRKSFVGKNNGKKVSKIDFKAIKERFKPLKNVVPVGIIQAKGEWLETYEIDENIKANVESYALEKDYKKMHIFNGSILKKRVYSGNVKFEILQDAYFIKNPNQVKSISIDLSDGKGYQAISANDIISAKYTSVGEKVIGIKFELKNKYFISYSNIEVVTLNEEEPTQIFNVSDNSSGKSNASGKAALSGGTAFMYAGCDDIFDRPVIIVEGFDATNDVPIRDIRQKYLNGGIERSFRNAGRDVVYLNFSNGGNDVRTNARVLYNLILDINRQKIGNQDLIVIGESMGGLVARYAIRRLLEQGGRTHNISHFISFDAPHKGANVPTGLQGLFTSFRDVRLREAFNIEASSIREGNTYLNSKAAKQLLIRYQGVTPHPDFTTLQNEFDIMGFPNQGGIQNISVVNGALDGSIDESNLSYSPGDRTLSLSGTLGGVLNVKASVFSNRISSRTLVSFLRLRTLGIVRTTNKEVSYNFDAFNYDLTTGGVFDLDDGSGGLPIDLNGLGLASTTYGNSQFSFVPFFSGTASTAPRARQGDLSRTLNQLNSNNWTPFDRVFGSNSNTGHLETRGDGNTGWRNLFTTELGIPFNTFTCGTSSTTATPPSPRINGRRFYMCELSSESLRIDNAAAISNLYNHNWRVTGPRSFSGNGNSITMFTGLRPGRYTVRATRSYNTNEGLARGSSSSSRAFTVFSQFDRRYGCNEGDDGGPIRKNADLNNPKNDHQSSPIAEDVKIAEESVLFWPNPVNAVLNVSYQMTYNGDVRISLIPLNYMDTKEIIITDSYRPIGEYQESFFTNGLKKGVYVLTIKSATQTIQKKVILK